jgi:4-amino-4-deoxy-L-arabinose transferase-like glycosyltransferase
MNRKILALWTIIAVALTATLWIATINRPFDTEPHAWASAHMAVMARSFSHEGVTHLRGVPVQNNPPLGTQPDRYIHWPPLFAILLGFTFKVFGDSVATAHVFVMLLNVIYLAVLFKLARYCFNKQVAILSVFGVVTLPVFFQYSTLVWTVNAGMIAIMAAIYCFLRATESTLDWKWIYVGMAAIVIGTLLSWEPILVGFALLAVALVMKSKDAIRAAIAYACTGVVAMAVLLAIYVTASPELRTDLWHTIAVRFGGQYGSGTVPIHALFDSMWYDGQPSGRWSAYARIFVLIGLLTLFAIGGLLLWLWEKRYETKAQCFAIGGLLGVWLGWFLVFPNHVYNHDYQWLLGAPLGGISIGVALNALSERIHGSLRWLNLVALPIALLVPLAGEAAHAYKDREVVPTWYVEYGLDIGQNTPSSAVILSNFPSMVPVYYSDRHILRYVHDEDTLRIINREVWDVFPNSDVYFATTSDYSPRFPCVLANFPIVKQMPHLVLFKMSRDSCR